MVQDMLLILAVACSLIFTVTGVDNTISHSERAAAFIGYSEETKPGAVPAKHIIITTSFGVIKIKPRHDISPGMVGLVTELAGRGCKSCHFYRHEPAPQNFGKAGFFGPPYALLQGTLNELSGDIPKFEGAPLAKKGDVCLIPNCKEFFIATADHDEWGHAHMVWGHVDDPESWATIEKVPVEPFSTITDAGNITTRWLKEEAKVPFKLSMEK